MYLFVQLFVYVLLLYKSLDTQELKRLADAYS